MSKQEQLELLNTNQLLNLKLQSYVHKSENLESQNIYLKSEMEKLTELYLELKRERFGKKSEKWESKEQAVMIFNEAEIYALKPDPLEDDEPTGKQADIKVKAHTKKRGHRKPLPLSLPRDIIKIELPANEQFAKDGTPLKIIGYEVTEKLDYEPSKMRVLEYHRAKYGVDSGDYEKTAELKSVLPKAMATEGLLSAIITSKFADGLPLYRQEEIFYRADVELSRTTMARWVIKGSQALQPILNILSDRLLARDYVSCDETRFQVLKEKDRDASDKSWMWVRSTPSGRNKIVIFDYDPSRSGKVAEGLFLDYKGYLQVDGYAGYNKLEDNMKIIRIGCGMHARRYFEKALTIGSKAGRGLAEVGLKYFKDLFDLEEEIRELSFDERFEMRNEKAKPIWDSFKIWVETNKNKIPSESKLGKAFHYFSSEYEYLIGYLKDGRLEMDSGFVERAIRKFAIGRNNWMFADTEAGAEASALLYSLVITMKINDVNPYKALKYVLEKIPYATTIEDLEELADVIIAAKPLP